MKVIIVDDEPNVRNTIKNLLKEQFPQIKIVSSVGSVAEGFAAVSQYKPELIFLDVELPDGTGFDLLKKISSVNFKVIFITGHQEYALDAIKVSALDYILKPIDKDELHQAIEKASNVINHNELQLKLQTLNENLGENRSLKRIILPTSEHLNIVSVSDIIRAEADSNYTTFWLTENKRILVSRTIKEYESLLSGSGMIRVHQSHLVNLNFIDKFVKRDGGYLLLKDRSKIPVSPNLKKKVLQAINDHLYE